MSMFKNKIAVLLFMFVLKAGISFAQIDTVFWFAAPWVTPDHWWKDNVKFHIAAFANPATVRVRQPASTYDTTFTIPAYQSVDITYWITSTQNMTVNPTSLGFDSLETRPANIVRTSGFKISSNNIITVVYDVVTRSTQFLNPETFSIKGRNALGREFVCPFQTKWNNIVLTNTACLTPATINGGARDLNCDGTLTQPRQQINIVATQPNTVVWIKPTCNVVGHSANVTYSVLLPNPGNAYTIENVTHLTSQPGNNLSGTIIVADKDIAVTVADDSVAGVTGCFDLMGDQIVPVEIVGKDYIVLKGAMNGPEHEGAYIVGTENFTQITINDGVVTNTLINKGDTYHYKTTQLLTSVVSNKNVYVLHATGYGCELGEALLPPLSCAGSSIVAFSRNNDQPFRLNILCKTGAENSFTLSPTALVPASAFSVVPGTGGMYMGAQIPFSTVQIPVGSYTLVNTQDVFALGVFNGNTSTGGLYHYMSSFLRRTTVATQTLNQICSGQVGTVAVTGTISGADITGAWSTSYTNGTVTISGGGTGTFSPVYNSSLNVISTIYSLSINDTTSIAPTKTITLYLSSTGSCKSVTDSVKLVINQRPKVFVNTGSVMCKNNLTQVVLSGTVTNALSGQWSGGNGGTYGVPGLATTYTPSSADLAANTITLSLTSQQPLPGCPNTVASLTVSFIDPPAIIIAPNIVQVCTNSSSVALNGTVNGVANTGIWLGGTGTYTTTNASPTTTYLLSQADLTQSSITLTLTSTGGFCPPVSNTILINIVAKPTIAVPVNFPPVCLGAGSFAITGTVSGTASQGIWTTTNGNGNFQPNTVQTSPVGSTYFINQLLDTASTIQFVLESVGGVCPSAKDSFNVTILKPPVVKVNQSFQPVCRNVPVALTGTVTGYTTTGLWTTSSQTSTPGTFNPGPTFLNGFYEPSDADYSLGYVVLTLASTNNGICPPTSSAFTASFVAAPKADFNTSLKRCANSAINFYSAPTQLNGTSSPKYNWSFGDLPTGGSSTAPDPLYTYTNSGQYIVTLTVTGTNNLNVECPDVISKTVTVKPLPLADFDITPACQNKPIVFTNKSIAPPGSDPITVWNWEFNCDENNPTRMTTFVPTTTVSFACDKIGDKSAALTVTAGLTPSIGCVSEIKIKSVYIFAQPKAEFGLTNNPTVVQEPVYFSDFSTPVGNIASWFWEFGDNGTSEDQTPIHTYQQAGIFSVTLTVIDKAGCVDTLRKDIDVTLLPQVPTGFTPNGDGANDLLFVKGGPFQKMMFRVYNSWGELLFETDDQKVGWDGKKNGVEQPTGVYVWTLTADMYNNRQVKKNGDINLIR
jgi:gliding motility-associated-like protein